MIPLPKARVLKLTDPTSKSAITHFVELPIVIGLHTEKVYCYVAPRLAYPLILGLPWLGKHDVRPDVRGRSVIFRPETYPRECLPTRKPYSVFSNRTPKPARERTINGISCATVGIGEFCELIQEESTECLLFIPGDHREDSEDAQPHALGCVSARLAAVNPADYDQFMKQNITTD